MSEIIQAVFTSSKTFVKTDPQWRYNKGQKLQVFGLDLPEYFEAHFSNEIDGPAKSVIGQDGLVSIPPEYFIPGGNIYCWLYIQEGEAHITKCQVRIPLYEKGELTDEEPTPEQQSALDEAIDALNDAVDGIPAKINEALAQAKASGEFDGADGADGQDGADGAPGPQGPAGENGQDGQNGVDGNSLWYTTVTIGAYQDKYQAPRRYMHGREGTPAIGDLVIGRAPGEDGAPTYLYCIVGENGPNAVMDGVGSLKGADGPAGADGKDGEDGAQGPAGADGADGSIIWWTNNRIASADDSIFINREYLNGPVEPTKDTVKIGDLIVGPEAGSYDLTLTTLYAISSFASKMCILTRLCRLKGETGDPGDLSAYRTAAAQDVIDSAKLDKNQGISHAGEFLVVGSDGNVTTQAMTNAETEAL